MENERRSSRRDQSERRDSYGENGASFLAKKRAARFVIPADAKIDYKNLTLLEKFITDSGKIISRRITGANGKQSRQIEMAIKRARYLGLLGPHSRS